MYHPVAVRKQKYKNFKAAKLQFLSNAKETVNRYLEHFDEEFWTYFCKKCFQQAKI